VALEMDVTWRRLVRDLAAEVRRQTGEVALTSDDPREVDPRDPRVGQVRDIAAQLERGASLVELAARLNELTAGVDAREAESLEAALRGDAGEAGSRADDLLRSSLHATPGQDRLDGLPPGHPVECLRREGAQLAVLAAALRSQLDQLAGRPSARGWRAVRPAVAPLVKRLGLIELRVRREREAWLGIVGRRAGEDAGHLLRDRQDAVVDALELLRRGLARDDAVAVLEHGKLLLERMDELALSEEEVLVPLAEQTLTQRDWMELRGLEDAVGWALIPAPPPWPRA
jgi:DUF438 domain-containing protein